MAGTDAPEGRILLINKPLTWTSFDVVNKIRFRLKTKKVGHAGTLDPLATGLLIVCVGKMTKRIEEFMGLEKEYTGSFTLGQVTASYDLETPVEESKDISQLNEGDIREATKPFIGRIQQLPPAHSAIKVGGKRAYEFARKGKPVELTPREVEISTFEITDIQPPKVFFRIVCSKGTYIRSIARDYGESLGVGAHLSSLCRTRIGPYTLERAVDINDIAVDPRDTAS
ncbi:tRNA pseudouridine(55) synthase TruB [Chryseolinea sp. T2]|uniref:tRNA pseudouridine(55) synthase TruB n=1 Tax=Chryseolinea sp. T2 TaxID=3129255 RepID=UPI0030777273